MKFTFSKIFITISSNGRIKKRRKSRNKIITYFFCITLLLFMQQNLFVDSNEFVTIYIYIYQCKGYFY